MHTILHIEDNMLNKHLLRRYFKSTDVLLLEAETGRQGINMAESTRPDLILLDYHLPDINGKTVASTIRTFAGFDDVPIIGLTADDTAILHKQMLDEGFDLVLTKPVSVHGLLHVVDEYLNTKIRGIA